MRNTSDKKDGLFVLAQGVPSLPKAVAQFLSQYKSLDKVRNNGQSYKSSVNYPDLIFLINFSDLEYACIEF